LIIRLSGKEVRPDFWVTNPLRSLVVEVKSDIRTIVSKTFATPYSLRFPRITKIWCVAGIVAVDVLGNGGLTFQAGCIHRQCQHALCMLLACSHTHGIARMYKLSANLDTATAAATGSWVCIAVGIAAPPTLSMCDYVPANN
jgi:hypothetical protein